MEIIAEKKKIVEAHVKSLLEMGVIIVDLTNSFNSESEVKIKNYYGVSEDDPDLKNWVAYIDFDYHFSGNVVDTRLEFSLDNTDVMRVNMNFSGFMNSIEIDVGDKTKIDYGSTNKKKIDEMMFDFMVSVNERASQELGVYSARWDWLLVSGSIDKT